MLATFVQVRDFLRLTNDELYDLCKLEFLKPIGWNGSREHPMFLKAGIENFAFFATHTGMYELSPFFQWVSEFHPELIKEWNDYVNQ